MTAVEQVAAILNETTDLETLHKCQDLVSNRIDVVSNSSISSDPLSRVFVEENITPHNNEVSVLTESTYLCPLVKYQSAIPWLIPQWTQSIGEDVGNMFRSGSRSTRVQYRWLSLDASTYSFGGTSLKSSPIEEHHEVLQLMNRINKDLDCSLDSCLISYYTSADTEIAPHSDDESILDQKHAICNISMGTARTINFYKRPNCTDPAFSQELEDSSMLMMLPGCQQQYKHGILAEGNENDAKPVRFCLSFRKLASTVKPVSPTPQGAGGFPKLENDGYQGAEYSMQDNWTHPSRQVPKPQNAVTPKPGIYKSIGKVEIASPTNNPEHVIIGDSLTRNIVLPGCITVTRGGAGIKDIPDMLDICKELSLDFTNMKSVTLCVGTNPASQLQTPLIEIVGDYNKLVCDITGLFVNATVGLFNIPRECCSTPTTNTCPESIPSTSSCMSSRSATRRLDLLGVFGNILPLRGI